MRWYRQVAETVAAELPLLRPVQMGAESAQEVPIRADAPQLVASAKDQRRGLPFSGHFSSTYWPSGLSACATPTAASGALKIVLVNSSLMSCATPAIVDVRESTPELFWGFQAFVRAVLW